MASSGSDMRLVPPALHLFYFNRRGKAEPIRLLLEHKGVRYLDSIIERNEEWPRVKEEMPCYQVPVLELPSGLKFAHTNAILRYLAGKYQLTGRSAEEAAIADMFGSAMDDAFQTCKPWVLARVGVSHEDPVSLTPHEIFSQERVFREVCEPYIRTFIGPIIERQLKHGKHWIVGDTVCHFPKPHLQLTWADFVIGEYFSQWVSLGGQADLLDPFPLLRAHIARFSLLPGVVDRIKTRPNTVV